jgi:hypothetical protein
MFSSETTEIRRIHDTVISGMYGTWQIGHDQANVQHTQRQAGERFDEIDRVGY